MNLQPHEIDIVGKWTFDGNATHQDTVCSRIEYLTTDALQKLAVSRQYGAWETLFRDPTDGRLWERTYPQGELQGGGPPRLSVISEKTPREKYHF